MNDTMTDRDSPGSATYETLLVEERADRVVVTLNRPRTRNAISARMVSELHAICELLDRAHALLDRMASSSSTALRLTKLVVDAPGAHPVADDLAQAVLFEGADKRERMTRFLERSTEREGTA